MELPYLIAEIGSCFNTFKDCLQTIKISADLKCSAVKFQMANWDDLYLIDNPDKEKFNSHFIKPEWLPELKICADKNNIDLIVSVFHMEHFGIVDDFVTSHKVASIESGDPFIIRKALSKKKHLFVSIGGRGKEEIRSIDDLLSGSDQTYSLLHCVVAYPTKNPLMKNIYYLRDNFRSTKCSIGISDHTREVYHLAKQAFFLDVIEKHFNPLSIKDRPDSFHSADIDQMEMLSKAFIQRETPRFITSKENGLADKHRRVLMAKKDIKIGTKFSASNVGSYRLTEKNVNAYTPTLNKVVELYSQHATKDYDQGDPIWQPKT